MSDEFTGRSAPIRSVLTALRVIETLAEEQPVGVSQLARKLGAPKTSVFRSLETLRYGGWVAISEDGQALWQLTTKALTVGMKAAPGQDLVEIAMPEISRIRDEIGETMHLLAAERDTQVIIARADGTNPLRTFLSIGTQVPFHATASGRAMLSAMPPEEVERILDAEAEKGNFDRAAVLQEVAKASARGYAENFGEWRTGIAAVASVIASARGGPLGALSASMPYENFKIADRSAIGGMLKEAGQRIAHFMMR